MKKILCFLTCAFMALTLCLTSVKAEELNENEPVIEEIEETLTEEDVLSILKNKFGAFSDNAIILDLLAWFRDAGVLSALAIVLTKYRKYKGKTVGEIVDTVSGKVKNEIDKRLLENADAIKELCEKVDELQKLTETFTKALVLMQDDSAKGKLAVLDYLSVNTNTQVKETKEKIEEDIKEIEEIKTIVNSEYESIF